MKVEDIMSTEPITVDKDQNLREVLTIMRQHNVTKLPVTEGGKLMGIVTDGTIADKLGRAHNKDLSTSSLHASSVMAKDFLRARPDEELSELLADVGKPGLTMVPVCVGDQLVGVVTKSDLLQLIDSDQSIEDIVHKEVHAVGMDDRLVHARRILLDQDIQRVPVLDRGAVRGILSEHEIAEAFVALKERDTSVQKASVRDLTVMEHMQANVVTGTMAMSHKEAAAAMMEHHVGALPIVDEHNQIQGIVTRTDLIKAAAA